MTLGLLLALVGVPLLGGIALAAIRTPTPAPTWVGTAARLLIATTACCALALLPSAGQPSPVAIVWLPGMGAMTLELEASGLLAALVTAVAALFSYNDSLRRARWCSALGLVVLAAANVAFVAGHFLLRYAALEIVALGIALAPLVELGGETGAPLARQVYLLLRIGDAALLMAILILFAATGTLEIGPALHDGESLSTNLLHWIAAGMSLAVWVKVGGWPLHIWRRAGMLLSSGSRTWLYGTVMPNLGLYLLYRISPLLTQSGPVQTTAQWVGACTAAWMVFVALTQPDIRLGALYVDAAMAGLVLFAGASGLKTVAWTSILVLTPLRLALWTASRARQMRVRAGLFVAGGGVLALWAATITLWTRSSGTRLDVLFVAEATVVLLGVWVIATASRILRDPSMVLERTLKPLSWVSGAAACAWGAGTLVALLFSGAARDGIEHITHGLLPGQTGILPLMRHLVNSPAVWIIASLAIILRVLRWRPSSAAEWSETSYDLEGSLTRIAAILNRAIEGGIHEQIVASSVQLVLSSAQFTLRVIEGQILEGSIRRLARAVTLSGRFTRQTIENEGLEGLIRLTVRAVLAAARRAQHWHTGKLRYNLAWVVASLALALLVALTVSPW